MTIAALVARAPLRMGASGDAVRQVQLALKERGFPLTGTGYFGSATDVAVESFQRSIGLKIDGVVGIDTATALDAAAAPISAPAISAETPLWLSYSLDHVGLREGPGAKDNPELVADIRTVAADYQHDATPWCAGWMSLCLARAGEKPSSEPLWALSYSDVKHQPVVKLLGPALGAIAVKTRNGGGHVTMVAGRTRGGALACCGGNQNNQVSVAPYAPSVFVGFYWPKGAALPEHTGMSSLPLVNTAGRPIPREA